jgi:hypothetical protein
MTFPAALLAFSTALMMSPSFSAQAVQKISYSQKALLKNWALCRCLAKMSTDESTKNDANASASAYLELGKQPIESYTELENFVNSYIKINNGGSITSEFNTMKCIDMFHSMELDRISSSLAKHRPQDK